MPAFNLAADELDPLIAYLKALAAAAPPAARDPRAPRPRPGELPLADGGVVAGTILNESSFDAQLRTADGRLRLLRRAGDAWNPAAIEPFVDWPSYNGSDSANRHSPLDQINRDTVDRLAVEWFYPIPDMPMIEGTPVVIAGVMYVTAVNQVYALDASTGREIWRYAQPRTEGLVGDPAIGLNRGVAVRGDRLFTVTDHAHVIALDRFSGELNLGHRNGRLPGTLRRGGGAAGGGRPGGRWCQCRRHRTAGVPRCVQRRHRRARLEVLDHSGAGRARVRDVG